MTVSEKCSSMLVDYLLRSPVSHHGVLDLECYKVSP